MLRDHESSAIVAVGDLDRARRFYRDVLGLELLSEEMEHVLVFRTGETRLVVYRSDYAGTNQANAVVWDVGDELDRIVGALGASGVVFEHYDSMERQGDVHVAGDMRIAWFRDPDGNILHLTSM